MGDRKEKRLIKLAEALLIQAEYEERLENLRSRLMASAKIQEGNFPPEDPEPLIADVQSTLKNLESLKKRIAITHAQTLLESGKTLSDALIEQEMLLKQRSIYQSLVESASISVEKQQNSPIRWLNTFNVGSFRHRIEDITTAHRILETEIQKTAWSTELLE